MTHRTVIVVGVGALGSHVVLLGRNWPVRLVLIDFDRVEQKNVLAQFHSRMGLGRNKAQALQQALNGLFGVRVEAVPHRLTSDNVAALLAGADLVLDCVDNASTRRVIQRFVQEHGVPCLHGALAADGSFARVVWTDAFTPDEGTEGAATCEDGEHLPFIALVAAQLAATAQDFLTHGRQRSWHVHPGGLHAVG